MHSGTIFRKDIIKSRYNTNKQCEEKNIEPEKRQ